MKLFHSHIACKKGNAQGRDLAHTFGDLNQSEQKKPESKPPLAGSSTGILTRLAILYKLYVGIKVFLALVSILAL